MFIKLEVLHLGYEVNLHRTITSIIAIANKYEILVFELRTKNPRKRVKVEED